MYFKLLKWNCEIGNKMQLSITENKKYILIDFTMLSNCSRSFKIYHVFEMITKLKSMEKTQISNHSLTLTFSGGQYAKTGTLKNTEKLVDNEFQCRFLKSAYNFTPNKQRIFFEKKFKSCFLTWHTFSWLCCPNFSICVCRLGIQKK